MATTTKTLLDRAVKVFFPLHSFFNVGKGGRAEFIAVMTAKADAFFIIGQEKPLGFGKVSRMAAGAPLALIDRLVRHLGIFDLLPGFFMTTCAEIRHSLFQHIGP